MSVVFSGHQPNFLPYMGVFYKLFQSDVFVLDDDVQYSSDGLHNANYLRISGNKHKVTVPVSYTKGDPINNVRICYAKGWDTSLLKSLNNSYRKAPHFDECIEMMERHLSKKNELLVDLNIGLFMEIASRLCIETKIVIASKDVPTSLKKNERNIYQCSRLGGDVYYSGIGGKDYNDEELFSQNGISIVYTDYEPVKYKQTGWGFVENLSVLDYLMNEGFVIPDSWEKKLL